jgi:hypothetical protein
MAITGITTAVIKSPEWGDYNILQINCDSNMTPLQIWQYFRNNLPECPYFIESTVVRMYNKGLNYVGAEMIENSLITFKSTGAITGTETWTINAPTKSTPYITYYSPRTSTGYYYGYDRNDPPGTYSANGYPFLVLRCDTYTTPYTYSLMCVAFKETAYGTTYNLDVSSYQSTSRISKVVSTLVNTNDANMRAAIENGEIVPDTFKPVTTDPYENGGGTTGPGGGTGTFDGTGDAVDIPNLPTLSATSAGFITLFNPTTSQLNDLASYMWTNPLFDMDNWKKIFADPMDAIIGLSIVPVNVPNGAVREVQVGNIGTGVHMTTAATQYVTVDCGTLNVNEYWGAYLDYSPYTKAELYLPYIGTRPIDVDDIMGKLVHVVYHVDILSGACCAYVKCGDSVLYNYIGQCSSSIPITGRDWTDVINGIIGIAGAVGSMAATGGASAPSAIGNIAASSSNVMKPNIEKSGAMAGTGGMMSIQTPYLILTRPRQAVPANQNEFTGYPAFITKRLGDLSGYTEIESIHLENVPATEQEYSEIVSLLKGGVIF